MSENDKSVGEQLGMIWVMLLFAAGSVVPMFWDYSRFTGVGGAFVRGGVAAFVAFCIITIMFWLSQLVEVRLPRGWYPLRDNETRARYRRWGVARFRRALLRSPFRVLNRDVHVRATTPEELLQLDRHMQMAETNHVIGFGLTLVATALYGGLNDPAFIPWFVALNVLGNVYPVLLQRYNRLRLARILGRVARP